MKAIITVHMDNDAFAEAPATELGRILRKLACDIENFGVSQLSLKDTNANVVGYFRLSERSY